MQANWKFGLKRHWFTHEWKINVTVAFLFEKLQALEKYKYEQSLEHTSQFIEKLGKELEEYHKHLARFKKVNENATQVFDQHMNDKVFFFWPLCHQIIGQRWIWCLVFSFIFSFYKRKYNTKRPWKPKVCWREHYTFYCFRSLGVSERTLIHNHTSTIQHPSGFFLHHNPH